MQILGPDGIAFVAEPGVGADENVSSAGAALDISSVAPVISLIHFWSSNAACLSWGVAVGAKSNRFAILNQWKRYLCRLADRLERILPLGAKRDAERRNRHREEGRC